VIPYDVAYYRPDTLAEALEAFRLARAEGLSPAWLGGGTEIVTMARDGRARPAALIDLKGVPECRGIEERGGHLRFGACLTLNEAAEQDLFPLLARAASGVADHTVRNSITLGGNITGRLPYREAVLPFLVCDGLAEIASGDGVREAELADLFAKRLRLAPGEVLVALRVPVSAASLPHAHVRRTRDSRVDYPLLTACFVAQGRRLRLAVSGLGDFPARLADRDLDGHGSEESAAGALAAAGLAARADMRASAEYRMALFVRALAESAARLGETG
jgi:CO/xanthine dehydrogenase FAD-binding subunit